MLKELLNFVINQSCIIFVWNLFFSSVSTLTIYSSVTNEDIMSVMLDPNMFDHTMLHYYVLKGRHLFEICFQTGLFLCLSNMTGNSTLEDSFSNMQYLCPGEVFTKGTCSYRLTRMHACSFITGSLHAYNKFLSMN